MVATQGLQELASWSEEGTTPASISAALVGVWKEAGRPRAEHDGKPVEPGGLLRARVANLLVLASTPAQAERAESVLADLAAHHPVRSVLLEARPDMAEAQLRASIQISCHPLSARRVCFERIRVSGGGLAMKGLGSLAAPLLVHDLPTFLWSLGDPHLEQPGLAVLVDVSDVLLVDSGELETEMAGLVSLANAARTWKGRKALADLNWNRLADWREVLAQFFDCADARAMLRQVRSLRIEVSCAEGASLASAQALLLVAWLASRLGWQSENATSSGREVQLRMRLGSDPIDIEIAPAVPHTGPAGAVRAVQIAAGPDGTGGSVSVSAADGGTGKAWIELSSGRKLTRGFALEERSEAELLAEEIGAFGREHALDDSLDLAGRLAERLIA